VRRAAAASRCHRELPIVARTDDARMLEGIIDLAFKENERWIIVDFKTDADLEIKRAHYEGQLRWYAFAVERSTGAPVEAIILAI
jgi:ATP-dependent exoDNAse (exonuclease V) beta subunit